jgi:hypothetical protein
VILAVQRHRHDVIVVRAQTPARPSSSSWWAQAGDDRRPVEGRPRAQVAARHGPLRHGKTHLSTALAVLGLLMTLLGFG